MTRFLRRNWTIRGGVVTPVCKIVSYYFIASKKTKNYHLLWFLVTIVEMFRYANIITDEEKENILNKKESENKNNE